MGWSSDHECSTRMLHVRIHTGVKPYSCKHCSNRFTWLKQLQTHLKSHHEGTLLMPDTSGQQFNHVGKLMDYMLRYKDLKPYVCSECPKHFCAASELSAHFLVHSDVKQFCCGSCGKCFKRKNCASSHMKICSDSLGLTSD